MILIVSMAASRNHGGRPRRPEALKVIYLRESLGNNWRTRKNSLGYTELTESEFAKVVHRQTDFSPGSPRVRFVKTAKRPLFPSINQITTGRVFHI